MTIRIHEYSGKENGMMIIGTASDIKNLGHRLIDSCNELPEKENVEWPRSLESLEISNIPNYSLSFHLETINETNPKGNGFKSEITKTIFFTFAFIGFISVIRWLIGLVI